MKSDHDKQIYHVSDVMVLQRPLSSSAYRPPTTMCLPFVAVALVTLCSTLRTESCERGDVARLVWCVEAARFTWAAWKRRRRGPKRPPADLGMAFSVTDSI